jgi:hypothetical protein
MEAILEQIQRIGMKADSLKVFYVEGDEFGGGGKRRREGGFGVVNGDFEGQLAGEEKARCIQSGSMRKRM